MYLFGYGSLLSPESVARTLDRAIPVASTKQAELSGYKRTWTARIPVWISSDRPKQCVTALFLDLSVDPNSCCNGVLIKVTEDDLRKYDLRESGYVRTSVRVGTIDGDVAAIAYIVSVNRKSSEGVILEDYVEAIRQGLSYYPADFVTAFWRSTESIGDRIASGSYRFVDEQQNEATGR